MEQTQIVVTTHSGELAGQLARHTRGIVHHLDRAPDGSTTLRNADGSHGDLEDRATGPRHRLTRPSRPPRRTGTSRPDEATTPLGSPRTVCRRERPACRSHSSKTQRASRRTMVRVPTAVVLADTAGNITGWDAGAERMFGHAASDAVGQRLDLIVPPTYREAHWVGFRRAMADGECRLDGAATNLPVLCADGAVRLFPGRFVFLVDARGTPAGALAVYAEAVGGEEAWGPVLPASGGRPPALRRQASSRRGGADVR